MSVLSLPRRRALAWTSLVLGSTLSACNAQTSESACASVGGTCVLGNVECAKQAEASAQDCNLSENPGGAHCCLQLPDGGSTATGSGDALAAESSADGGAVGTPGSLPISVTQLEGPVPTCPAGTAHPNVCCDSGPRQATACLEKEGSPFQPCAANTFTFPDRATCCPLDDDGACFSSTPDDAAAVGTCSFPCAPVAYPPDKLPSSSAQSPDLFASCATTSGPGSPCEFCCYGALGTSCLTNQCEGPGPCGPVCGTCPSGWTVPVPGQLDLCCRTGAGGVPQCFSQSTEVQAPDSGGCSGGPAGCECDGAGSDGHDYEAWCDSTGCSCSIDGQITGTFSQVECTVLFTTECGFPGNP